jgi:hypothetical protein
MQKSQDTYINFLLISFSKIEMTKLSKPTSKSHDQFTKHLLLNDKKLWVSIKQFLKEYENCENGCIVVDGSSRLIYLKEYKKTFETYQASGQKRR